MPYLQVSRRRPTALSQASMLTIAGRGRSSVTNSSQHAIAAYRQVVFVMGMASGAVAVIATLSDTPNRIHRLSNAPPPSLSPWRTPYQLALPLRMPASARIWIGSRIRLPTSYRVSLVPASGTRLSSKLLPPSQLYFMQYSLLAARTEAHHPLVSTRPCQTLVVRTSMNSSVSDNTARRSVV
jgi:hypothetical protein